MRWSQSVNRLHLITRYAGAAGTSSWFVLLPFTQNQKPTNIPLVGFFIYLRLRTSIISL